MGKEQNVMRGYRAATHNPNVSDEGKLHAQQELRKHEQNPTESGEERNAGNVARGLKAATHNPNVTDAGKAQARERLQGMGESVEQPGD